MARIAYVNGSFLPLHEANVSILDRGFLFADGIYEVTAVLDGRLVDTPRHMARLDRSAREIGMRLAETPERIEAIEKELVERNRLTEGVVYLQATRGAEDRDFLPSPDLAPTLVMFTQEKVLVDSPAARTGIGVATVPDIRWGRRDIKSVMLLAQVLAKQEAARKGAQDAWLVTDEGMVTEGASSTAWILTYDGKLVTRDKSHVTLPGCTGDALADLVGELGLTIDFRPFSVEEALDAKEAFNSAAGSLILPIVSIDGRPIGDGRPGPVTTRLRELYIEHARR
ncbi:D-amino-acid transaminase [Sphingomonas sp. CGMCC 1.13654]|uniref:Probable branched-chain-amino-acid aminotransferase n=1 Tax=Sphingomonas chungangi TaxID=2683589 RepID=A0A838L5N7_9SPHN|nr:D-amino-acid transaminase [Sphingomonas chungangi]MBA2932918.1 D-amino-acid transaminase [Sphingomonas chungangi]MVW56538.1 D-amino-acid transaminase [Sphingomonas chungangi]